MNFKGEKSRVLKFSNSVILVQGPQFSQHNWDFFPPGAPFGKMVRKNGGKKKNLKSKDGRLKDIIRRDNCIIWRRYKVMKRPGVLGYQIS